MARQTDGVTRLIQLQPLAELLNDHRLPSGGREIEANPRDANRVRPTARRRICGGERVEYREVPVAREGGGPLGEPDRFVTVL